MKAALEFLAELRDNNDRAWFAENKERYREAERIFGEFGERVIALLGEFDSEVAGLALKDCTYRIYRDTRFSKDKTPYKTHIGLYVCPAGKKSGNAGYYFHLEPGNCLIDAGVYMPEPVVLKSVRDEIFDNGAQLVEAIEQARGFSLVEENSLKRLPVGYPPSEWDNILKLKELHIQKPLSDDYVLAPDLAERVAAEFRTTYPFMALMHRAVRWARENG